MQGRKYSIVIQEIYQKSIKIYIRMGQIILDQKGRDKEMVRKSVEINWFGSRKRKSMNIYQ